MSERDRLLEAVKQVIEQREAELEDVKLRIRELRRRRKVLRDLLSVLRTAAQAEGPGGP